ncbi:chymotrypsin BI-like [Penaeus japonicus]|uniref:chymotrypsin BI-like n=1 Tax=Penaeus japonicus TaxID=27405 RepID=UPI001C70D249|nr:chymotrypsin BI-like [Penaeus japonicus]
MHHSLRLETCSANIRRSTLLPIREPCFCVIEVFQNWSQGSVFYECSFRQDLKKNPGRMFALVLLCCVAGIASLPPLDSGDANQATNISWIPLPTFPVSGPPLAAPRIINGRTAEPHAYPYQAAISCYRFFLCGGSVVSDVHVVTAAHCVDR